MTTNFTGYNIPLIDSYVTTFSTSLKPTYFSFQIINILQRYKNSSTFHLITILVIYPSNFSLSTAVTPSPQLHQLVLPLHNSCFPSLFHFICSFVLGGTVRDISNTWLCSIFPFWLLLSFSVLLFITLLPTFYHKHVSKKRIINWD